MEKEQRQVLTMGRLCECAALSTVSDNGGFASRIRGKLFLTNDIFLDTQKLQPSK